MSDFIAKTLGLAEVTNKLLEKSAAERSKLEEGTKKVAAALVAAGQIKESEADTVAANLREDLGSAAELIEKYAHENNTLKAELEKKANQVSKLEQEPRSLGSAAENEKTASASAGQKESDALWERQFGA